jgi:hypothetical protein
MAADSRYFSNGFCFARHTAQQMLRRFEPKAKTPVVPTLVVVVLVLVLVLAGLGGAFFP